MKYEDLLNWKNKCFRKYCSTKLNWQGSATIIIYCEGASWGGWHTVVQCRSAFFLQQDTAQRLDRLRIKGWAKRKSAQCNMRKESRINNQSVEQRGSGGAWGGYHILDFNTCNGGVLGVLDCSKLQCCSQEHLWIVNRVENALCAMQWRIHSEFHYTIFTCHNKDQLTQLSNDFFNVNNVVVIPGVVDSVSSFFAFWRATTAIVCPKYGLLCG